MADVAPMTPAEIKELRAAVGRNGSWHSPSCASVRYPMTGFPDPYPGDPCDCYGEEVARLLATLEQTGDEEPIHDRLIRLEGEISALSLYDEEADTKADAAQSVRSRAALLVRDLIEEVEADA